MDTGDDRSTLTKKKIAHYVGCQGGVERPLNQHDLQLVVHHALEYISHALSKGRKVELRNFGVFEIKPAKAKPRARNPKTNEEVFVPPHRKIHFKAGKKIKAELKKEFHPKS